MIHLEQHYPEGVVAVLQTLVDGDEPYQVRSFDKPAHHASEAAELLGCALGAVVKSLIFQLTRSGGMVLVLVSGKNRADMQRLAHILGEPVRTASPEDVLAFTGYPVGSVPPFGVKGDCSVIIDADLMTFEQVWAAAGSAHILIGLSSHALKQISRGNVKVIKQRKRRKI